MKPSGIVNEIRKKPKEIVNETFNETLQTP